MYYPTRRRISFPVPATLAVMEFQPMFDGHGNLVTNGHEGPIFSANGKQLSQARKIGDMPNCTPAPHDKTWLEERGVRTRSTTSLFLLAMENYCEGNYRGRFYTFSKYWDTVKIENGIGPAVYPGMA